MVRSCLALIAVVFALAIPARSHAQSGSSKPHYLFVWAGDRAKQATDFLVVIDADPASARYGRIVTSLATDQQTMRVHHTEYTMPQSGMLFANDHDAGRTFIFDLREPLHPRIASSFNDMDGYMHPHSYLRLPDGHVLATFQHVHHETGRAGMQQTGGLVEIDDRGNVIRSASNADPAFPQTLLMPYSLVVLPKIDRVLSTNSSMHDEDTAGVTYQLWRLSDLKLLRTAYFDTGEDRSAHINPEEPRLGPDGSVFVQTLACGLERVTGIGTDKPRSRLVFTFPGTACGVPTIVGHYLVQSVPAVHGYIVLDIARGDRPVEVSRLSLSDTYFSHWTAWGPDTQRLVVTTGVTPPENRLYLLKLNQTTGQLSVDDAFRDLDGQVGFSFAERDWPHGWKGAGSPHGAVFSR